MSILRIVIARFNYKTDMKKILKVHTDMSNIPAKCRYPLVADTSLRITGYHNPALEAATLMFSCPSGKILTVPNMSTCMENGEWEPDPQVEGIQCAG